jgi:hypothetical protein
MHAIEPKGAAIVSTSPMLGAMAMHVESVNESQLASSGKILSRRLRAQTVPEPAAWDKVL